MKARAVLFSTFIAFSVLASSYGQANAFCGVIQESATGKTAEIAMRKARHAVKRQVRQLRNQYGRKLQVEDPSVACLGGAAAIDANGHEIYGDPSCRVTTGYCVNP